MTAGFAPGGDVPPGGDVWRGHAPGAPWPPLAPGEVHVWRATLDAGAADVAALAALLDDAERARAARFHAERHRARFVVARGTLRRLLGGYTGVAPRDLGFVYGEHGKPALAGCGDAPHPLRFNLSHCDALALFAFARDRDVGVDVERTRAELDVEALAERVLAAREAAALRALPAARRAKAFVAAWARREAYLKGRGVGLAAAGEVVRGAEDGWLVRGLEVGGDHAAALAVERRADATRLRCWRWTSASATADAP